MILTEQNTFTDNNEGWERKMCKKYINKEALSLVSLSPLDKCLNNFKN